MMPIPGVGISTPFGQRGTSWSCNRDSSGRGIHTGADFAANTGRPIFAARPGTARHVNFGSAFGNHQLAIVADDGTRDFYAHMSQRLTSDGQRVAAGAQVGAVGAEGNVTGPHLHFERHNTTTAGWSCAVVTNPQPSLDWGGSTPTPEDDMPLNDADKQWIADTFISGLRSEGISGAGDAQHMLDAGYNQANFTAVGEVLRSEGASGGGDPGVNGTDTILAALNDMQTAVRELATALGQGQPVDPPQDA